MRVHLLVPPSGETTIPWRPPARLGAADVRGRAGSESEEDAAEPVPVVQRTTGRRLINRMIGGAVGKSMAVARLPHSGQALGTERNLPMHGRRSSPCCCLRLSLRTGRPVGSAGDAGAAVAALLLMPVCEA